LKLKLVSNVSENLFASIFKVLDFTGIVGVKVDVRSRHVPDMKAEALPTEPACTVTESESLNESN
jgi:hypothetical protein